MTKHTAFASLLGALGLICWALLLAGWGTEARGGGDAPLEVLEEGMDNRDDDGRPNLLLLLTDDQRHDALGVAGNDIIETPHLDSLASTGVRFRNAFVTTSICAVSRASILSGQYARRHGIHDFAASFTPDALAQTYPAVLRQAGYYTGFIGKFGVGSAMPDSLFDVWHGFPGQGTYNEQDESGNPIHLTRKMGNQAVAFLEAAAERDAPFALSISFKAPHVEAPNIFLSDAAFDALYADATIPPPHPGDDFASFPAFFRENNEGRTRWQARFSTPELYQENVKRYYRLVFGVDRVVGQIRAALDALGLAENTVILLTSDNGFFLGEHGLAGKWYAYDASIRVPMIFYDPRAPETQHGQVRDEMALNIDVAPTLLALAGESVPAEMQGRNLTALLRGETSDWREDFFYEHLFAYDGRIPRTEGVVADSYKYIRYIDPEPPYEELYDTAADPLETVNLADSAAYQDVLATLRERWATLREGLK